MMAQIIAAMNKSEGGGGAVCNLSQFSVLIMFIFYDSWLTHILFNFVSLLPQKKTIIKPNMGKKKGN
jgi:hypothetical protein